MGFLLSTLYIIGLYGAYLAGSLTLKTPSGQAPSAQDQTRRKIPYTTLLVTFAIAIPSVLQFFFPAMLPLWERDYARFLAGEWWRLFTSLFVQDGGIAGTVFNLISLALVGWVAEQLWDRWRWLLLFFGGGILSQFAGFLWQPLGAGNSVATFSLAASIAVLCLSLHRSRIIRVTALLSLTAGVVLLFLRDIHGPAMLIGAGMTLILSRGNQHRSREQR